MLHLRYFSDLIPRKTNTPDQKAFQKLAIKLLFFLIRAQYLRKYHFSIRQALIARHFDHFFKDISDKRGVMNCYNGIDIRLFDEKVEQIEIILFVRKIVVKVTESSDAGIDDRDRNVVVIEI